MSNGIRIPKHPRKSTGSDVEQLASPDKSRSTKRRKVDHVDDGIAASFIRKIAAAEQALKDDLAACEAHMAREEAEYAAAMERIVNARREAAIWRADRIAQLDATRRELMAQQQDAELAAEMARIRLKRAQEAKEAKEASVKESNDIRHERKKRRNAELKRAEEERAARQQPEIIVESDLCYISDLDDEFMDAEDEPATSISDFDDGSSTQSHADETDDELMANTTARPEKIEVEEGGESDDDQAIEDLISNHSDYSDDSAQPPPTSSFKSHLKAAQAEARARQELLERQARARAEAEQAFAAREQARREREWRAQQEAARREQAEQLKREQERIRRERQERARKEYERQEWQRQQQQQQQRRTDGSAPRRSMDTSSGATAAAWARYTTQWNKLQGTGAAEKQTDAILYFSNIPWPTVRSPRRPEDITKEAVAALVLSNSHSQQKNTKARLRELLLLWHPDKFIGRWMAYVVPADQEDVTEGVMAVARIANELLADRNL
ncbi:hypothetical protein RhiJN_05784 [Ceratobasidium sp. AG-Ba]|nr:hypothetical protein RhiJN_05784 [Ceratobasidium sp. AG-Ba]QRW06714.1 hypothetical protein RhiLY_05713 [Ceratobasidium sp. AG-Ba]